MFEQQWVRGKDIGDWRGSISRPLLATELEPSFSSVSLLICSPKGYTHAG